MENTPRHSYYEAPPRRARDSNEPMMLPFGYDIQFEVPSPVAMVALLHVHPSRVADLGAPDELHVEPGTQVESFIDSFGNRCSRFVAQQGTLRFSTSPSLCAGPCMFPRAMPPVI
jgi:hypothetical protein